MPLPRLKFNITLRFIAYLAILSFLPIHYVDGVLRNSPIPKITARE